MLPKEASNYARRSFCQCFCCFYRLRFGLRQTRKTALLDCASLRSFCLYLTGLSHEDPISRTSCKMMPLAVLWTLTRSPFFHGLNSTLFSEIKPTSLLCEITSRRQKGRAGAEPRFVLIELFHLFFAFFSDKKLPGYCRIKDFIESRKCYG